MGKKSEKPKVPVFAYFYGLAYALASKIDEIIAFKRNGVETDRPNLKGSGSFWAHTGTPGAQYRSGNSGSTVTFYDGTQTTPDPYLTAQTGKGVIYKNLAYMVINGFVGDNVSSVPQYSILAKRTKFNFSEYDEINEYDVNPITAIYYILTKLAKIDSSLIDTAKFKSVAKEIYDEGFGISFLMDNTQETSEWIKEILRVIEAALYIDPQSGLIGIRLFRDDYDINLIPKISSDDYNNLKFKRKYWEDCYSRVCIKYTDTLRYMSDSVSLENPAVRQILGHEKNYEIDMMIISNPKTANLALARLLRKMSYPYAELRFNLSGDKFKNLIVGDVLNFSSDKLGIDNLPVRIMNIGADKADNQTIEIEAIEDVFAGAKLVTPKPGINLHEEEDYSVDELKYYHAVEATAEMGGIARSVLPMCVYPKGAVIDVRVKDGISGDSVAVPNYQLGELISDLEITDEIDDEAYFDIRAIAPADLWAVSGTRAGWQRLKFTCLIDDEFINFQFRSYLSPGVWRIKTLIRGLSGTKISRHLAGAKVWFAPEDANDLQTLGLISADTVLRFWINSHPFAKRVSETYYNLDFHHSDNDQIPYAPSNLYYERNGDEVEIKWRYAQALSGAMYSSADVIMAGDGENIRDNKVVIKFNGLEYKFDEEEAKFTAPLNTNFEIFAMAKNGRISAVQKFTI